jgi:transcription antitermination factor NusG
MAMTAERQDADCGRDARLTGVSAAAFDADGLVEGLAWYVAVCNPRCEERAQAGLDARGVVSYRPMAEVVRAARPNRPRVTSLVAMFPRYLFVGLAFGQGFSAVRGCDGVADLVTFVSEDGPVRVAASEVRRIRAYDLSGEGGRDDGAVVSFALGDKVRIIAGPFADLWGDVSGYSRRRREVTLGVDILGGAVPVVLPLDSVAKRS